MGLRASLFIVSLLAAAALATPMAMAAAGPAAVVDRFQEAVARGDAAAAAATLAEDVLIYEQGRVQTSKADYVAGHLPGDISYSAAMTRQIISRRTTTSGAFAVVMTQGRTTGTYQGKPVDRQTTETVVLKRARGVWLITDIHWSSQATKP